MEEITILERPAKHHDVTVDVTVHAFQVPGTDEVLFAIGDGLGGKKPPAHVKRNGNTLEFIDSKGTINIGFEDHTKSFKLEFRTSDPIWSCQGTDCPAVKGTCLKVLGSPSTHLLSIENDGAAQEYGYSLWFRDTKHKLDMSFDPIIKNIA